MQQNDSLADGQAAPPALIRRFVAKNFQCALDFVNTVGAVAEEEGHHPDIGLTGYRNVQLVLYTHKVGGVTPAIAVAVPSAAPPHSSSQCPCQCHLNRRVHPNFNNGCLTRAGEVRR